MTEVKKQSHQLKALMFKNIRLQARQPCTNICQILTPIICLVFTILIRKIAIDHLANNNDNIFKKFPNIPQKFGDYSFIDDYFADFVIRNYTQWYNYYIINPNDTTFIGTRNGQDENYGMLSKIADTYKNKCQYNFSKKQPFVYKNYTPPIFLTNNKSVQSENQMVFDAITYLNMANEDDINHTSILDKIPDGTIIFEQVNPQRLSATLRINDLRVLDYHKSDGITKIRFRTNFSQNDTNSSHPHSYYLIAQGFMTLQNTISAAYIKQVTGKTMQSGYVYMPFISNQSVFVDILVNTVTSLLFPLSLSLLLPVFLYLIVLEKEEKLIQMMRMNGLKMRNYWLTYFIFNFCISVITNLVFFLFGYFFLKNAIFSQTGKDVLFILLLGWILAQIGMSTFFQVFLASSRAANIIGYLISIWTNLIGATLSIALYQYPRQLPIYFRLYPTFAFNRVFYLLFNQCSADRCVSSLSHLSSEAGHCIIVLYLSFIIFQLLGMYLFQVIPQQYGTRQSLTFPIKFIISRFQNKSNRIEESIRDTERKRQNQDENAKNQKNRINNSVGEISNYSLAVCGLKKVYDNGKIAVKGMDLLIQGNQVFGLLGPNGAGKTTLISMITGVFQPSNGNCFVAGHSIITEIEKVHVNIGVCPQFDILWPQLTVEEHLYFYSRLRGIKSSNQKQMVHKTLEEVNLTEFKNFKSSELSGGMKRRLSIGISMVGNPRIVFLDEPTSGLDPQNRRNLWEVLNKCRENRALFLTTHLMEEADTLCDRIGIITHGSLRTIGTQQKLKKMYGNGYYLSLNLQMQRQKPPNQSYHQQLSQDKKISSMSSSQNQNIHRQSIISTISQDIENEIHLKKMMIQNQANQAKMNEIQNKVMGLFPHAVLERVISGYMRFNLGNVVISEVMVKLTESGCEQISKGWGLTNSNLQDVFLQVVKRFDKEDDDEINSSILSQQITKEKEQNEEDMLNYVSLQNQN